MYKKIIVLICVFIYSALFVSCSNNKPEPLRICVDIEYANGQEDHSLSKDIDELLKTNLLYAGKQKGVEVPVNFEVEFIPAKGLERDAALERIRTEVMAGRGPDIFISACTAKNSYLDGLFDMPEKAMELSLFMTLDEYMEAETHFAEWNKMNETILNAGRTEEGQQVVPLSYTIPVAVYGQEEINHTPSKTYTWMNMLDTDDISLSAAAVWTDNTYDIEEGMPFAGCKVPMTEFILGAIADYEEEELLFTEEELSTRINEIFALADQYKAGKFDSAPAHYVNFSGQHFDIQIDAIPFDTRCSIQRNDTYGLIPLYSDDGGVTAEITSYVAINRNTKYPIEAFRVLDYLSSYNAQRTERLSHFLYECGNRSGIPMYDSLMSENERVYLQNADEEWCLLGENHQKLSAVRDQVTNVHFRDALVVELDKLYMEYQYAIEDGNNVDNIISEGYRKIQQMLRE